MAQIDFLQCSRCGHKLSAQTLPVACPMDAGLLYVRYDLQALRQTAQRDDPERRAAAALRERGQSLGMWRYAAVLPEVTPVMLVAGWTPMLRSRRFPGLSVKEEGAQPTGSVAVRGASMALSMARHLGVKNIGMAAMGETASAMAGYAAAAAIRLHLFAPGSLPGASYVEAVLHGADVVLIAGDLSACRQRAGEAVDAQQSLAQRGTVWIDSAALSPYLLEGAKTLGFEMLEQLGWTYPDALVCPGEELEILALWKAFDEAEQLGWVTGKRPRLYAAGPSPEGLTPEILRASGGRAVNVNEDERLSSLRAWAAEEGMFLSPPGAACAAAYEALLASNEMDPAEQVVLINPSAGWKQTDAVARAMGLRMPGSLPTSLPVGGIITPV